ncbi:MAG TPA: hypothetical protein VJS92_14025 [Candidatus Polarisedimenticolaceae bacterium]|nr:hypothetical protein [Candidatus Polarisedimenticolaceae bacterium]
MSKAAKTAKSKSKSKSKPRSKSPAPIAPPRLAPAAKAALKLPVAASTRKPVRPESMRPRSWVERTIP